MKFGHFNRRLHLYLAMALLPWFVMFAFSSLAFAHPNALEWMYPARDVYGEGNGNWETLSSESYQGGSDLTSSQAAREAFADRVVAERDLECSVWVSGMRGDQFEVRCVRFLSVQRITYNVRSSTLLAEEQRFRLDLFLTRLHARSGYPQDDALNTAWAIIVDVVCLAMILWVASGTYMWWKQPRLRRWGAVSLAAGIVTFLGFMVGL